MLALVGCLCGNPMNAQQHTQATDPLYLQFFAGTNKSANEHLPWTEFSKHPFSGGMFIAVGKEFKPLWGWRASWGMNGNRGRSVPKCETNDVWKWKDTEWFGDITFDLADLFRKPSTIATERLSVFSLKSFAGVGMLYSFSYPQHRPLSYQYAYNADNHLSVGFRLGITASWRINKTVSIGAELSQTFADDHFNGVADHRVRLDGRTNLSIGVTYTLPKRKRKLVEEDPINYSTRLRQVPELPFVLPEREAEKHRSLAGRAYLDFPVSETIIYPKYRRNPIELKRIRESVEKAQFDKSLQITSISLHGYASPESPYSNNTRLAKGRTAALAVYLEKRFKLSPSLFKVHYTPEDWGNLRKYVKDSLQVNAPSLMSYQTELLRVIDSNMSADPKEEVLKKVGGGVPYKWLLKNVYPALRHTDYVIEYDVREFSLKKSRKLIYTHPEALSVEEMYKVAKSYPDGADEYYDAMTIAADQYPNDTIANLNAACACIKAHRLKDARRYLSRAGASIHTTYVRDVIDAMEGKIKHYTVKNGKLIVESYE